MKIFLASIMAILVIGSYFEIKQFEDFIIKHDCKILSYAEPHVYYSEWFGGSFKRLPEKTTYVCSNGEQIIR